MNTDDVKQLAKLREEISEVNNRLKHLNAKKAELQQKVIEDMTIEGLSLARTDYGTVSISKEDVASVKDWMEFEEYIYENRALHLLQRRVANAAYRDELAIHEKVPGVEVFTKVNLSLTNKVT